MSGRLGLGLAITLSEGVGGFSSGKITVMGDSIPAGQYSSPSTYVAVNRLGFGAGVTINNLAVSGGSAQTGYTRLLAGDYDAGYVTTGASVMVIEDGTNDLANFGGDISAAALYAVVTKSVQWAKLKGFRVLVCTLLPRTVGGVDSWSAGQETKRLAYNVLVLANAAGADGTIDQASIASMADPANATYYADGLHPTNAGQDELVPTWRAAIAAVLAQGLRASPNYMRLTTLDRLTETARSGGGYNYSASEAISSYAPTAKGYPSVVLPASTDGWIALPLPTVGVYGPIIGFSTSLTPGNFYNIAFGIYADMTTSTYLYIEAGASSFPSSAPNPVTIAAGDIMRVRRTGSTGYLEVSKDAGGTWTVAKSLAVSTGVLKPHIQTGTNLSQGAIRAPYMDAAVA